MGQPLVVIVEREGVESRHPWKSFRSAQLGLCQSSVEILSFGR